MGECRDNKFRMKAKAEMEIFKKELEFLKSKMSLTGDHEMLLSHHIVRLSAFLEAEDCGNMKEC
ncbi:MAG TPA: hypothetical protein VGK71_09480 [Nitrospirota bacterium]|jgi:hypothetical protein